MLLGIRHHDLARRCTANQALETHADQRGEITACQLRSREHRAKFWRQARFTSTLSRRCDSPRQIQAGIDRVRVLATTTLGASRQ